MLCRNEGRPAATSKLLASSEQGGNIVLTDAAHLLTNHCICVPMAFVSTTIVGWMLAMLKLLAVLAPRLPPALAALKKICRMCIRIENERMGQCASFFLSGSSALHISMLVRRVIQRLLCSCSRSNNARYAAI